MFSRFTENFNFTFLVIAVPLLVAAVSFILYKTTLKNNRKVLTISQRALGDYTFMGLMFVAYSVTVSLALEVMFGTKNMSDMIGKISVV
jgi:hypothetical protein